MIRKIGAAVSLILIDLIGITIIYFLAYHIRSWLLPKIFPSLTQPLPFKIFVDRFYLLFLYILIFAYDGLYSKRLNFEDELQRLWRSLFLSTILVAGAAYLIQAFNISRMVIIIVLVLSLFFLPALRWLAKDFLYRIGIWRKKVLVFGDEESAEEMKRELTKSKQLGYEVVANKNEAEIIIITKSKIEIRELLQDYQKLMSVNESIPQNNIRMPEIMITSDIAAIQTQGIELERIAKFLFVKIRYNLLKPLNILTKNILELFLAIFLITISLPLILFVTLLLKLTIKGPILFKQKRIGKDGRLFVLYKFRTMHLDAEEREKVLAAMNPEEWEKNLRIKENQPLITHPIGRFLRRFGVDELPQLINVLKGEMALVGPRPYLPREMVRIAKSLPIITKVKPGITGLWQVSGRKELSLDERIILDEYYVKNWSIWLDLSILILTVNAIISGKGAY